MRNSKRTMTVLCVLSAVLLSLPFLVPHSGAFSLFALIPLLLAERIATELKIKRFWIWHYGTFVLWNILSTFWVWNASAGGAVFAFLANSLQMSLIFGSFRLSRKVFKGAVPYLFLAFMWIAWERAYFSAQISWPWLTLGNSFARSISLVQWYEYLGTVGGSLWIWAVNLSVFGIISALMSGRWKEWNVKARFAALAGCSALIFVPVTASLIIYSSYKEERNPVEVLITQPNIEPYRKFGGLSQDQQNAIVEDLIVKEIKGRDSSALLIVAPETFTNDVVTNEMQDSKTVRRFSSLLSNYPGANFLFGAFAATFYPAGTQPSPTAVKVNNGLWYQGHNSALIIDGRGSCEIFYKSKLVPGVEMMPYPKVFGVIDKWCGGVMGKLTGQEETTLLNLKTAEGRSIPLGCAICYESVYGEYCTEYIKKGAQALVVITNDSWWGDTPGYRQHLSYASLRAIENRRDIARCANTGISAIINQRGDIVERSNWWKAETIKSEINLNDEITFFAKNGDIAGRLCSFAFIVLLLALVVRLLIKRK